jgi:hypothetical protein
MLRKIFAFILLIITICVAAYVLVVFIPSAIAKRTYDGAKQIGQDISDLFHFTPEITVNNTVVLQQQASILELATVQQTFRHEYHWENEWLGSTKKIRITGTLDAKAGFDLRKKFRIDVTDDHARIYLPSPQILSVEPSGDYRFEDEHGVWNWVNAEDRSKALSDYHQSARRYADQAAFINDAKLKLEQQLGEILSRHGKSVEFIYDARVDTTR